MQYCRCVKLTFRYVFFVILSIWVAVYKEVKLTVKLIVLEPIKFICLTNSKWALKWSNKEHWKPFNAAFRSIKFSPCKQNTTKLWSLFFCFRSLKSVSPDSLRFYFRELQLRCNSQSLSKITTFCFAKTDSYSLKSLALIFNTRSGENLG